MAQLASIDWENKLFYLHIDTVNNGFDAWEAVAEAKVVQQTHAANAQNYPLFLSRQGKQPKDNEDPALATKFTPRFVSVLEGWRGVPYDSEHRLDLLVEIISDEGLSDRDVFDRSSLTNEVDIDAVYPQVEVLVINGTGGSGSFTSADRASLESARDHARSANLQTQRQDDG